jgi:hypothetical protein
MMLDDLYAALSIVNPTLTFIFAYQDGVEPKTPYILITKVSDEKVGMGEEILTNNSIETTYAETHLTTIRLSCVGRFESEIDDLSIVMKMRIASQLGKYELYQRGISFVSIDDIIQTASYKDTRTYITNTIDLVVSYKKVINIPTDYIEVAQVTANVEPLQPVNFDLIVD